MRTILRRVTAVQHSTKVPADAPASRQPFSSSPVHQSEQSRAARLDPRWFTDLHARIRASASAGGEGSDRLKRHLEDLDRNWLDLMMGREGFLTGERWRGLDGFPVHWGDMDAMCSKWQIGHVNNIMYNRYAESGRVNWVTSLASLAPSDKRQQWLGIMSPRGIGLILKSIKTDYKLPIAYPDKITVLHKLAHRPTDASQSILLDAVIVSEKHRRVAARCYEDIVVYDYAAGKKTALPAFMVQQLQQVYHLQEEGRLRVDKTVEALESELELEARTLH